MKQTTIAAVALTAGTLLALPVLAQNTADVVQRDVNQQQRIENGLQSGQLNTKEAAKLEKGEANIDKMEQRALSDGKMTNAEKQRIEAAQSKESQAIARAKSNGVTGDPNSVSSQRMQADVQRNVNQETRVEQGIKSGQLTNREVGNLERGQAHVDNKEAKAGANGHISANEQHNIQAAENHQSKHIYNKKHNDHVRQ
jgi:hypothetical protein